MGVRFLIAGTNLSILLLGLATSVLSSRALAPSGRGDLVAWQAWTSSVATLCALGLPQVLVMDATLPKFLSARSLWRVLGPIAGAATVFSLLLTWRLDGRLGAIVGAAFMSCATIVNAAQVAAAQRSGAMTVRFNLIRLSPQVAALVAALALYQSSSVDPNNWMLIVGLAQMTAVCLGGGGQVRPSVPWASVPGVMRRAVRVAPIAWASLLQYRADLLLVTALFPRDQGAFYAIAVAAQSGPFVAGQSGGMHWFSRGPRGSLRAALLATSLIAVVAATVVCCVSGWIVPVLYGEDFRDAVGVAQVLVFAAVPLSLDYFFTHVAMLKGVHNTLLLTKISLVGAFVPALALTNALFGSAIAAATVTLGLSLLNCALVGAALMRKLRVR